MKLRVTITAAIIVNVIAGILAGFLFLSDGIRSLPVSNEAKLKQLITTLESQPPEKTKTASVRLLKELDSYAMVWIGVSRKLLIMCIVLASGNLVFFAVCLANYNTPAHAYPPCSGKGSKLEIDN